MAKLNRVEAFKTYFNTDKNKAFSYLYDLLNDMIENIYPGMQENEDIVQNVAMFFLKDMETKSEKYIRSIAREYIINGVDFLDYVHLQDYKLVPDKNNCIDKFEEDYDLQSALSKMNPKYADILVMRYGLYDDECTLQEIGNKYHISRERVRQLEGKALKQIKDLM